MPERIQLSRRKGWRMPPNTVKVDRSTKWGNPFRMDPENGFLPQPAVEAFRAWLETKPGPGEAAGRRTEILSSIAKLKGKNLACWCPLDQPCHADVLLEIANHD